MMREEAQLLLVAFIVVLFFLRPVFRAWGRRVDSSATIEALREEIMRLDERVADLESANARLPELEERVDFAERLLARAREQRVDVPSALADGAR
jgi:Tfp pilus assembly protein PilO